MIFDRVTLLF